jgi:hypothetical protein
VHLPHQILVIRLAHALRRAAAAAAAASAACRVVAALLLLGERLEHAEERARDVRDVLGQVLALLLLLRQRPLPRDLGLE